MARIPFAEGSPYTPADQAKKESVLLVGRLMVNAALTAPIAGGVPSTEAEIAHGEEELEGIAREMERLAHEGVPERLKRPFLYEAAMLRESDAAVFLGNYRAHSSPMDCSCGMCGGRPDCSFVYERVTHTDGIVDTTDRRRTSAVKGPLCMLRSHDLGYAVGSALWVAANHFVDAKALYSVGLAGRNLGLCRSSELVVGIAIAALSKNPYVDISVDYHLNHMAKQLDGVRRTATIARQLAMIPYQTQDPARGRGKP
ncbi:MAG: hypothetical protein HY900_35850 [Deltaproteobacteria bacterium]|nr:hypothetical protein [Deltaproteobacteria bacterium]